MDFTLLDKALLSARGAATTPRADTVLTTELLSKLPTNTVLRGWVSRVTALSENQRASILTALNSRTTELLSKTSELAPKSTPSTPSTPSVSHTGSSGAIPADLKSAQILLARQTLFLLEIQTPLGQVLSYSKKPLDINQTIALKVTENGQLSRHTPPSAAAAQTNSANLSEAAPAQRSGSGTAENQFGNSPSRDITQVNAGLRRYLPAQKPLTESLSSLKAQLDTIGKFYSPSPNNPLPSNSTLALVDTLLRRLPSPADLTNTGGRLQQEILKSGQFYERAAITSTAKSTHTSHATPPSNLSSTKQLMPTQAQGAPSSAAVSASIPDDLKHLLLVIEQLLPAAPKTTVNKHALALKSTLSQVISLLLKPIDLPKTHPASPSKPEGMAWIEKNIRPLIQQMIARVTTLQLGNIQRQLQDVALPHYQFELPVRVQEHFFPVILDIMPFFKKETEKLQEKNTKKKDKKTKRLWQARIELTLQTGATLVGDIAVSEDAVSTQLWSDSDDVKGKIRRRIDKLKNKLQLAGINVDTIEVRETKPSNFGAQTKQPIQSLIDITT